MHRVGHALIGARQWIPAEQIIDGDTAASMRLPADLPFRTKGELAIDICRDAYADGVVFDAVCGDEVYGGCTQLREFFEQHGQTYVLRVACTFMLQLGDGARLTCRQAVVRLLGESQWEVRGAGAGSKGQRWYAWASIATASPHHLLLVRRHLRTGDLAFHYCYLPDGGASVTKLIRAAGLRWPVEETSSSARTSSASTSARLGCTPRSSGTPSWSWPPWPSAPSPPRSCETAPIPRHHHPPPRTRPRHPTPGLIPLTVPRNETATDRRSGPPETAQPRPPLDDLAAPSPSTITLVPPTHSAWPRVRPGQIAIGGCRT